MAGSNLGAPVYVVNDAAAGSVPVALPEKLLTSGGIDGTNPRLRVDVGQTGFFAGREFRTFSTFTAITTVQYIEATVPINIILFGLTVELLEGDLLIETIAGATSTGTYSTSLPILPRNTMSERPTPIYASVVTLKTGGDITGGTVIDVIRVKAADNSNFAASVGGEQADERGIGAGLYHYRITPVGAVATTFVFKARWEERP